MIRPYKEEDLEFIKEHDFFMSLAVRYNKDIEKENVFTKVDDEGNIHGVLALEYHYTWSSEHERLNKVAFNIAAREEDKETHRELIEYAKSWCDIQKEKRKDKAPCLTVWLNDSDYDGMNEFLSHGFKESEVCACLKFDLTEEIPEYKLPEGMKIERLSTDKEHANQYIEMTARANKGTSDSINQLFFLAGDPSFKAFVVMEEEKMISAASIWKITEERSAVENICTIPAYRRRNLARADICHALKEQKKEGYKIATLSAYGENLPALSLYLSLGFKLYYNQIEMHYN